MTDFRVAFGPEWNRFGTRLQKFSKYFQESLYVNFRTLGIKTTRLIQRELNPVRYKGTLERSISFEIDMSGRRLSIGPTAAHAKYIYYGTKPHWAPIAPLKEWARWKLGDEKAAWAVQRSIAKYGTSRWAARRYGGKGENLFLDRVIACGDFQQAIRAFQERVGRDLVVRLNG